MMETIDNNTIQAAAEKVIQRQRPNNIIHTVTITLNGAHGGADLIIQGMSEDCYEKWEETIVIR